MRGYTVIKCDITFDIIPDIEIDLYDLRFKDEFKISGKGWY